MTEVGFWTFFVVLTVVILWLNFTESLRLRRQHELAMAARNKWTELDKEMFRHYQLLVRADLENKEAAAAWHLRIVERLTPEVEKAYEEYKQQRSSTNG